MQKVIFKDLGFKPDQDYCGEDSVLVFNIKNQEIVMKKTIPTEQKILLVSEILGYSVDDYAGYFNPFRLDVMSTIIGIKYYSNLEFDNMEDLDIFTTYDILENEGFKDILYTQTDFQFLINMIEKCAKHIVKYNNSAAGIIDSMKNNSDEMQMDLKQILESIAENPDLKNFIPNVMETIG